MKLRKGQRLMMGKELEGLNYKELENLERQLHDGMLAVKNRKDMALLEEIEQIKLREQRTMKENEALKKEVIINHIILHIHSFILFLKILRNRRSPSIYINQQAVMKYV
ncbi:putative transcription factor, K-box [Helianthus annuus]|nr:putative transcription factor, K-box [Helianthus annuus]